MKHLNRKDLNRLVISLLILIFSAIAQDEIPDLVTDRPDATESAFSVPKGLFQIETGFVFSKDKEAELDTEGLDLLSTLLRFGVGDGFELRLGFNFRQESFSLLDSSILGNSVGLAPLAIGFKYEMMQGEGWVPQMALLASIAMPVGSSDYTSDKIEPGILLSFSHDISDDLGLGYNLGMDFPEEQIFKYSLALGYSLSEFVGIYAEVFGQASDVENTVPENYFDAGITWLLLPNIQLDASVGYLLHDHRDGYFMSTGFSWRLPG